MEQTYIAALARGIMDVAFGKRVVVALHEDCNLRRAVDLVATGHLANPTHENVWCVVQNPSLVVMNSRVVDKVIGWFNGLSIPTHHRDSDVTIASNIAAADTTVFSTGDIHAHLAMVGNGAAVK